MSVNITWNTEDGVTMPRLDFKSVESWIARVAEGLGFEIGRLNYIFCDDEGILDVNRRYLGHDYYTDIITFDYSRGRKRLCGDMYISLDTVKSNSLLVDQPAARELLRVIIHGVLHLCGINDKGPGEREIMERHEDESLALLDRTNSNTSI